VKHLVFLQACFQVWWYVAPRQLVKGRPGCLRKIDKLFTSRHGVTSRKTLIFGFLCTW